MSWVITNIKLEQYTVLKTSKEYNVSLLEIKQANSLIFHLHPLSVILVK